MAKIHINDVTIGKNPSPFSSPFEFQITFECIGELNEGLYCCIWICCLYLCSFSDVFISITSSDFILCKSYIDLEWKIIYVGSAESDSHDQVLDSVLVGPVPIGRHTFVFQVCYDII